MAHEEGASGVHLVEEDSSEEDHEVEDFKEEDLEEEDSAVVAVLVDVKYQKHRYHSDFDRQITRLVLLLQNSIAFSKNASKASFSFGSRRIAIIVFSYYFSMFNEAGGLCLDDFKDKEEALPPP